LEVLTVDNSVLVKTLDNLAQTFGRESWSRLRFNVEKALVWIFSYTVETFSKFENYSPQNVSVSNGIDYQDLHAY